MTTLQEEYPVQDEEKSTLPELTPSEIRRYSRHLIMPEVGTVGQQKLKAAATRNKDQEVLIRGDRKTQFGVVAQVFDACLLAKLHSISIMARPVDDQPR